MSKVDAQRAMREAKYASNRASGASRGVAAPVGRAAAPAAQTPATNTPAVRTPAARPARPAAAEPSPAADGARCGHKSMNGRACTREAAHSEKNHRYS
jgi:hypothetical protein